jgi:hypothetical protein
MAILAALLGGCATSTELEDMARTHALRADQAAAGGNYDLAAHEKAEANRLHAKAIKRAYQHGETASVQVPGAVPTSPKGY